MSDETTPPTVIDTRLVINNSLHGNKIVARENLHVKGTAVLKNLKVKEDIILKDGDELNTYLTQLESSKQDTIDSTTDLSVNVLTVDGAVTDDKHAATKHYVDTKVSHLVDNAPEALDTLKEISEALQDETVASTVNTLSSNNKNSIDDLSGNVADLLTLLGAEKGQTVTSDAMGSFKGMSVKEAILEAEEIAAKATLAVVSILTDEQTKITALETEVGTKQDLIVSTTDLSVNVLTVDGAVTDDKHAATKEYVDTQVSNLVDNAPEALDTLKEIAEALQDETFASTVNTLSTENKNTIADLQTTVANKQDLINSTTDLSLNELTVHGDIIPAADGVYSLGSNDNRFKHLYLEAATMTVGESKFTEHAIEDDTHYPLGEKTETFTIVYANIDLCGNVVVKDDLTVENDLTVDGNVAILGDSNSTFDVCSNEIVLNADKVDVCGNLFVNGDIELSGDVSIFGPDSSFNVVCDEIMLDADKVDVCGNLSVNGDIELSGDVSIFGPDSSFNVVCDEIMLDADKVDVCGNLSVNGDIELSGDVSIFGPDSSFNVVCDEIMLDADKVDVCGNLSVNGDIELSGDVSIFGPDSSFNVVCDEIKLDADEVDVCGNLFVNGDVTLGDSTSALGFFGSAGTTKPTLDGLTGAPNLNDVHTKVNQLLVVLEELGLITIG